MPLYKNIIFDLGGVLLDISYETAIESFEQLGFNDFAQRYSRFEADRLFSNLETGKVHPEDFYTELQKAGDDGISKQEIKHAWNSIILSFRKSSIDYLKELKHTHRLFLLSNTNKIHHEYFSRLFSGETGYPSLEALFSKVYYSHETGMRKPDREIYDFVMADAGIRPEETLFVDDSSNNIDAARQAGWKAHLLLPGERIEQLEY